MKEPIKKFIPAKLLLAMRKAVASNKIVAAQYTGNLESILQCCISYNQYGGYCLPLSSIHRPASQTILNGKVWEEETLKFMSKHCGTGDIIHAGTYFGDFLPALSKACHTKAKVWAFEPNLENYKCAIVTTVINDLNNVEIKNAGLGSQNSSMSMLIADENGISLGGESRLIKINSYLKQQIVEVDIFKIDDIICNDRKISIIQLDVEGFEQSALAGGIATIQRCKPILILETLPDADWLSKNIFELGYKVLGEVDGNTILSISC